MDPEGPDGYRYKPDGLMKQSFSITTATHQKLHLISYYARSHPASSNLVQPTQDASLKHIRPVKGMYPESTVHEQQNVPVRTSMISSMPHHTPLQHSPVMGYNRQGATHPASYQQLPANSYGWPPSPVGTPPTNMTGVPVQQYVTPVTLSGSAIPGASGSYGVPPPIAQFAPTPVAQDGSESPRMYERPLLPTPSSLGSSSHRGSVGMLLAPRSPNNAHAQIQRSTPPLGLPLPYPTQPHDDRLSPAATSISTSTPPEGEVPQFDISPLRSGSTGGDSDAARSLEVQDIPSEKFGFREDVRALRVLDRVFSAWSCKIVFDAFSGHDRLRSFWIFWAMRYFGLKEYQRTFGVWIVVSTSFFYAMLFFEPVICLSSSGRCFLSGYFSFWSLHFGAVNVVWLYLFLSFFFNIYWMVFVFFGRLWVAFKYRRME
jgi:hypothetical protein